MIETSAVKYDGRRPASWRAAIINVCAVRKYFRRCNCIYGITAKQTCLKLFQSSPIT